MTTIPNGSTDEKPAEGSPFLRPGVRDYLFLGLAALLVLFLALSVHSSLVPALLIGMMGVSGLLLRFVIAPGMVLFLVSYFLLDPYGQLLTGSGPRLWRPEETSWEFAFAFVDLIIVTALMTYLIAQYRAYSLVSAAIPTFRRPRPRQEGAKRLGGRRPGEHVRESEFPNVFVLALAAVLAGQLLTLFVFAVGPEEPRFGRDDTRQRTDRTMIVIWAVLLGGVVVTALLGYFRMKRARPEVARRLIEDTAWNESYREQSRVQRWRVWRRWWES